MDWITSTKESCPPRYHTRERSYFPTVKWLWSGCCQVDGIWSHQATSTRWSLLDQEKHWRQGSLNWMPPELLGKENDVFAAGCLFFAYLTGGVHPFGSGRDIVANIKQMFAVNVHSKRRTFLLFVFSSPLFISCSWFFDRTVAQSLCLRGHCECDD